MSKKRRDAHEPQEAETDSKGKASRDAFVRWGKNLFFGLLGLGLIGWFVYLLHDAGNNDRDPFEQPLVWIILALLFALLIVYAYCTPYSRCPKCGRYALSACEDPAADRGKRGVSHFSRFLKSTFSAAPVREWFVCKNCGHIEQTEDFTIET